MKTNCGIYKITNLVPSKNGICKVYIGSSKNLKTRKNRHFNDLKINKHQNRYLQRAYNKLKKLYGDLEVKKYLRWEVIKEIEKYEDKNKLKEELLKWENIYLSSYKIKGRDDIDYNKCYNLKTNAESGGINIHGMYGTQFYTKWIRMNHRCVSKDDLSICNSWRSFINFKEDMYNEYIEITKLVNPRHVYIHLLKNNDKYCKENCTWSTEKNIAEYSYVHETQKYFKAYSPDNVMYISNNQHKFGKEHNLDYKLINMCLKGKRNSHKNWKFEYIKE